jgi:hypothetical protein
MVLELYARDSLQLEVEHVTRAPRRWRVVGTRV